MTKVDLNVLGRKLDIYLEYATDSAIYPVCGKLGSVYDQQPERVWRRLDTMQFETLIHAKTPRVGSQGTLRLVLEESRQALGEGQMRPDFVRIGADV